MSNDIIDNLNQKQRPLIRVLYSSREPVTAMSLRDQTAVEDPAFHLHSLIEANDPLVNRTEQTSSGDPVWGYQLTDRGRTLASQSFEGAPIYLVDDLRETIRKQQQEISQLHDGFVTQAKEIKHLHKRSRGAKDKAKEVGKRLDLYNKKARSQAKNVDKLRTQVEEVQKENSELKDTVEKYDEAFSKYLAETNGESID